MSPSPATPKLARNVKLLGWASFWNDVASEMLVPVLPLFLFSLGAGKQALGWVEGVADATASLLKLFSGVWSDRAQHRRGLIAFGYAVPALVRPLLGLATTVAQVFAIRAADRFGKGVRTAPRDALIADSSAPEQRGYAFGFHRAMDHLGAALGPLLAVAFLYFIPDGLRTLFLLTLIPGLVVTAIVFFGLRERPRSAGRKEPFRFQVRRLGAPFWTYLLAIGVFALGSSTDLFLLVRLQELGFNQEWQPPLIWCGFHLLKSYGNVIIGRWTDRVSPRGLLAAGWLVYALIYLGMGLVDSPWLGLTLFMLYSGYYALSEPPEKTLLVQLVPADLRGQAFGWFHFVTGVMILPASVLFGWLYDTHGASAAFGAGAGLALAAVILLGVGGRPRHDASK